MYAVCSSFSLCSLLSFFFLLFFFFFQAEDGIRDTSVTGVQTCALPISGAHAHRQQSRRAAAPVHRAGSNRVPHVGGGPTALAERRPPARGRARGGAAQADPGHRRRRDPYGGLTGRPAGTRAAVVVLSAVGHGPPQGGRRDSHAPRALSPT